MLHHVAFRSHDFETTLHFLTEVMEFPVLLRWTATEGHACAYLDTGGGTRIEVFGDGRREDPYGELSLTHLALAVEEVEAAHQKALEGGAHERVAPFVAPIESQTDDRVIPLKISFVEIPGSGMAIEFVQAGVV